MRLHYIPAGERDGIWARFLGAPNPRPAQLHLLASWDESVGQIGLATEVDVVCWNFNTLESVADHKIQSTLLGFLGIVIRDHAFWLTTLHVHCIDNATRNLFVASQEGLSRLLELATRGGLKTLIIHELEPQKKAIAE